MAYFMTGATGFIGRHLLERLLRRGETVYCLVRAGSLERFQEIAERLQGSRGRAVVVRGDLLEPRLGVESALVEDLAGKIQHFFHVAALYGLSADSETLARHNVDGTRNALDLAAAIEAGCFHHVSSVAVAGHYEGTFTEAMLEEAEDLSDPYASTKHAAEVLVRTECPLPYRIYRPSVVVGHSQTGEIDRVEGVYHAFRLIQRVRDGIPEWLPRVGLEAGSLNVVPVDFVAAALDHIAHAKELDRRTFHLVDPQQRKASEIMDEFCRAARAPTVSTYLRMPSVPKPLEKLVEASERLPAVRRISDALLAELGLPRRLLGHLGHSTEYACDESLRALAGSGIAVPELGTYAGRLWDFWEQKLASLPARSAKLARAVEGKRVLIAQAGGKIEQLLALRLAASGAQLLLLERSASALDEVRQKILRAGGNATALAVDLGSEKARSALLARILERSGGIDIAICGAAEAQPPSAELAEGWDPAAFDAYMRTHCLGALDLIARLLPGMRERRSGQLVMLAPASLDGSADPVQAAAAGALDAYAASVAVPLAADGIAVTSVHVPAQDPAATGSAASLGKVSPEQAAELICDALIQRPRRAGTWLGTASELSRAAAPQAFDAASSLLSQWPNLPWPDLRAASAATPWSAIRGLRKAFEGKGAGQSEPPSK